MSDRSDHTHDDCSRFEDWLLESGDPTEVGRFQPHLDSCAGCREQWTSHQLLVATFAGETVPELSPAFPAGLDAKLEPVRIKVSPLTGWRRAALIAYAALAVALMTLVLKRFPLPDLALDTTSPWTMVIAMLIVPLSLWVTMLATRILPRPRGKGAMLAL